MAKITKVSDKMIKMCEYYECNGDVTKFLKAYKCSANVSNNHEIYGLNLKRLSSL